MAMQFWDEIEDGYEGEDVPPSPYDVLVLGGKTWPGKAQVKCTARMKLDIKKASGSDGSQITNRGHESAKVDITITVWTPSQLRLLDQRLSEIWRLPSKASRQDRRTRVGSLLSDVILQGALEISHPALTRGVTHVVIESLTGLEPAGESGAMQVRITAVQYTKPSPNATRSTKGHASRVPATAAFETKNAPMSTPSQNMSPVIPPTKQQGNT